MNHKAGIRGLRINRRWQFWPRSRWAGLNTIYWGLALVFVAPIGAQIVASSFNIWYTVKHTAPLLTDEQLAWYKVVVLVYNLIAYPAAIYSWARAAWPLNQALQAQLDEKPISKVMLGRARRRCINLPWWFMACSGAAWFGSIPIWLTVLSCAPGPLNPQIFWHLPTSLLISASIALTHGVFVVEMLSQRLLFPVLFEKCHPAKMSGTFPLTLKTRGLMWAFSAGVCPIASVLLLMIPPNRSQQELLWFAVPVTIIGIIFALITAWMLARCVTAPVRHLQQAAREVANGNLDVQIDMLRADEFGPLISEFNQMINQLRDNQNQLETFGRHVGHRAAKEILSRNPGLGGVEQELTILFADVRSFTRRCATLPPGDAVKTLNLIFGEMVQVVEEQKGMVNKFLGDGMMALFGVGTGTNDHAWRAYQTALNALRRIDLLNDEFRANRIEPIDLRIGIHTGRAVVGSIGAPNRQEYTAIGNAVNIASRVEKLTRDLDVSLLVTRATYRQIEQHVSLQSYPPQMIKGHPEPLVVYAHQKTGRIQPRRRSIAHNPHGIDATLTPRTIPKTQLPAPNLTLPSADDCLS